MTEETKILEPVSVLFGLLIGILLTYFYNSYSSITIFTLEKLIMFVTIPSISAFVPGLITHRNAVRNGLIIGLATGLINIIMMIFLITTKQESVTPSQTLLILVSVLAWMILGATSGRVAKEYER